MEARDRNDDACQSRPATEGAALLDELCAALTRYVVLPSEAAVHAVALWIAATHGQPAFEHAPRLAINAPEKRCGKSRLLDIIEATCHNPLLTVNATTAAIFRSIGEDPPTLIVDEADTIFGTKKAAEQNEDLRGLLNAGHQRGRPAIRCVGPHQEVKKFPTFAMAALAGIGELPDTIRDRAVVIRMRRRKPGEEVKPYRHRRDGPPLHTLRDRLAAWVRAHLQALEEAEPAMPLEDRAADTWEPLFAIAELAGGPWPERAAKAATEITNAEISTEVEASLGVRLLTDCRAIFTHGMFPGAQHGVIASEELVKRLRAIDDAPWDGFGLNTRGLSQRLEPYGIRPDRVRPDGRSGAQVRGYKLADFIDAFERYCPPVEDPTEDMSPPVTASPAQLTPVTDPPLVTDRPVTTHPSVTALTSTRDVVTDGDTTRGKPSLTTLTA